MSSLAFAFNRTRRVFLATDLTVADTHWARLCGLMGAAPTAFRAGRGLWIVPSHGVHTFAMRFPIDVLYLDGSRVVVHLEQNLKPWRIAPVRARAASVLELPTGTLRATGTALGDEIDIQIQAAEVRPA
jgi:uncharacterized membrane protein (UPF0127 family)